MPEDLKSRLLEMAFDPSYSPEHRLKLLDRLKRMNDLSMEENLQKFRRLQEEIDRLCDDLRADLGRLGMTLDQLRKLKRD